MRRFLPTLRTYANPAATNSEYKVVLADYYSALASSGLYGSNRARPWPVERAVAEAYERLVWIFKSVEAIAGHASRLPFRVKDGEDVVDDHPLYRVLNQRANPLETGRQFRKRLSAQILLSKRGAFIETTRSRGGEIIRLDLLPPGRTRPVPGHGQDLVDHFEVIKQDGSKREIDVELVRWLREPHPLDPYCGVTPLEAAGLSVELDFFTRLYNVSFMRNDGRPGGVLGIDGEMDEDEMDRVEARFGKGPVEAGKLTVINGKITYADLAARPRDMAYEQMSKSAKNELLCAFGVPESILGFAADRTYANADAEAYNFWSVTMPPHLDLLATGFDEDSEDDLEGFFDTADVEVLQRAKIARREEARAEFDLGLINIDEYRDIAGHEPVDRPETRALYLPSGKTPVPTSKEDAEAFGLGDAEEPPAEIEPPPERLALEAAKAAPEEEPGPPAPAPAKTLRLVTGRRPITRVIETKQTDVVESTPDQQAHDKLEMALAAALTALAVRLTERAVARLGSPKIRKGTRHWVSKYPVDTGVGVKALDAAKAVDGDRWQEEAEQVARPIVAAAATTAASALFADLSPPGSEDLSTDAVGEVAAEVVELIGESAARQAAHLVDAVKQADRDGTSIDDIGALVRHHEQHLTAWADGVAAQAATATMSGARDAAAQAVADKTGQTILRQWRARNDGKVRGTHTKAHGQHQPLGEPFEVGEARLRYPGDPDGPPGEVANCRCVLNHRAERTGRYVSKPIEKALIATGTDSCGEPPKYKLRTRGPLEKHLPGRHDQSTHGRRGARRSKPSSSSASIVSSASRATDFARWRAGATRPGRRRVGGPTPRDMRIADFQRELMDAEAHLEKIKNEHAAERKRRRGRVRWEREQEMRDELGRAEVAVENARSSAKLIRELPQDPDYYDRPRDEGWAAEQPIDPAQPLAMYGDMLHVADESATAHKHLTELENVPVSVHAVVRDHMTTSKTGGIYVGDTAVPDLDSLGHLHKVQPRGWRPGDTWNAVPGAYSPDTLVVALGGGDHGHGSTSLALHEFGHGADHAVGVMAEEGSYASATPAFRDVYDDLVADAASKPVNPYFLQSGDAGRSETWAESFAAWAQAKQSGKPPAAFIESALSSSPATAARLAHYYDDIVQRLEQRTGV